MSSSSCHPYKLAYVTTYACLDDSASEVLRCLAEFADDFLEGNDGEDEPTRFVTGVTIQYGENGFEGLIFLEDTSTLFPATDAETTGVDVQEETLKEPLKGDTHLGVLLSDQPGRTINIHVQGDLVM